MARARLLLLGAGGHAESCIDVIEREGTFDIAGLLGTAGEVGTSVLGYPVVGADDALSAWVERVPNVIVTVGQIRSASIRMRLFHAAREAGAVLPSIVSPLAHVSRHASIGAGSIVMHGAVVNASARVGENCIVNTMALVEHGGTIESHCHISTGARLNSGVQVGAGTFIGSGTVVTQVTTIGARCIVGLGQVITRDVPDDTTVMVTRSW
jgi:sugar O-acyltransferase (sialic acid O-acetyltransferase NeuD family)